MAASKRPTDALRIEIYVWNAMTTKMRRFIFV